MSDRAYGRLKERVELEVGPYRGVSDETLAQRVAELEHELGVPAQLPPANDESKPNQLRMARKRTKMSVARRYGLRGD